MWLQPKENKAICQMASGVTLNTMNQSVLLNIMLPDMFGIKARASQMNIVKNFFDVIVVVGGVIIVISGIQQFNSDMANLMHWLIMALGAMVAVTTALGKAFDIHNNASIYRNSYMEMKNEIVDFCVLHGSYSRFKNHDDAFEIFREKLKKMQNTISRIKTAEIDIEYVRKVTQEIFQGNNSALDQNKE